MVSDGTVIHGIRVLFEYRWILEVPAIPICCPGHGMSWAERGGGGSRE